MLDGYLGALSLRGEDEIVCWGAASHPFAKKGMSTEDYMRAEHVVPKPYPISQRGVSSVSADQKAASSSNSNNG